MRRANCTFLDTRRRRAFTALEALTAAAILAILTAATSGALVAGRAQSQLARDTLSASFLAQAMMDEVMRLPFNDPNGYTTMGPDPPDTSRGLYNNIDDYSGYTDGNANWAGTGATSTMSDFAGNAYPASYQEFQRTVTMTAISSSPTGWGRTLNGLLVTVAVSKNGTTLIQLQRIAWQ